MDMPVTEWQMFSYSNPPYKGQIVEVLCWKPAIYNGVNDFGYHEWRFFDDWQNVHYWKDPSNPNVVNYVRTHLIPK